MKMYTFSVPKCKNNDLFLPYQNQTMFFIIFKENYKCLVQV